MDVSTYTTTYTVNAAQRVTQVTNSLVDTTHPASLADSITYYPFGAIKRLINGATGGGTQRYEVYDFNKRLQVYLQRLGDSVSVRNNFCYHYNYYSDAPLQMDCGNGYPALGTAGNNGSLRGYVFRDNGGSPSPDMDHSEVLTYDGVNRLDRAIAQNTTTPPSVTYWDSDYTYDRWGNPTCSGSGACTGISYEAGNNNRILQVGTAAVTEDAAGNVMQDDSDPTVRYYGWDGEGRMNWVSSNSGTGACPSNAISCFVYNALGQRVEMKNGAGTSYTEYAYDVFGNLIGADQRSGFVYRMYYLGGRPIARHQDGKTYFMHPNQLGSTTLVTDQTGATIQKTAYYPFGQVWQSGGLARDSRFASMDPTDAATGNNPTLFRMQNPRLYRWLSPDPLAGSIMNPQSLNRYAYVMNNPVNFVDPLGLKCITLDDGNVGDDGTSPSCNNITGNTPGGVDVYATWGSFIYWVWMNVRRPFFPASSSMTVANEFGPGGNGYAGGGGPFQLPPLPPPPPAPPIKFTCEGTATYSAIGPDQATGAGALAPQVLPARGTVAIAGEKTFGIGKGRLRRFAPFIEIVPSDLDQVLSQNGGPSPPFTVGDIGDVNIRNSATTRFDIYRFDTQQGALNFGLRKGFTTITVPAITGAGCPAGFTRVP